MRSMLGIAVGWLLAVAQAADPIEAPLGMVWIPGGEFTMGSDDVLARPNEKPSHRVKLDGFWIDETPVTNAQFQRFVNPTGYVTVAERKPEWEELKKQLPPGTARPDDSLLVAGPLTFATWAISGDGCGEPNWKRPEGPGTDLAGRENHPAVQVCWDGAVAYAKWARKRLPTEAECEFAARGGHHGSRYY